MKVKKIAIRPDKIGIDLVLCPKSSLYLQDLYCRRCPYFELNNEKFIQCNFIRPKYGQSDPIKDKLIKDLSGAFIKELPIKNKKKAINNFTQRIENAKSVKTNEELLMRDLSQHIKKQDLSTKLDNFKKETLKKIA